MQLWLQSHNAKAQTFAVEAAVCAHFLKALPRLPMERGTLNTVRLRGNGDYHFLPLTDADSPSHFLFHGSRRGRGCKHCGVLGRSKLVGR